jgi:hypothetical protein
MPFDIKPVLDDYPDFKGTHSEDDDYLCIGPSVHGSMCMSTSIGNIYVDVMKNSCRYPINEQVMYRQINQPTDPMFFHKESDESCPNNYTEVNEIDFGEEKITFNEPVCKINNPDSKNIIHPISSEMELCDGMKRTEV